MKLFTIFTVILPLSVVARPSGVFQSPGGSRSSSTNNILLPADNERSKHQGLKKAPQTFHLAQESTDLARGTSDSGRLELSHAQYLALELGQKSDADYLASAPPEIRVSGQETPSDTDFLNPGFFGTDDETDDDRPVPGYQTEDDQSGHITLKGQKYLRFFQGPPYDPKIEDLGDARGRINRLAGLWWKWYKKILKKYKEIQSDEDILSNLRAERKGLDVSCKRYNDVAEAQGLPQIAYGVQDPEAAEEEQPDPSKGDDLRPIIIEPRPPGRRKGSKQN